VGAILAGAGETQKITKAMQMVAAAKLRRAQSAAENARPYAERIEELKAPHRPRSAVQTRSRWVRSWPVPESSRGVSRRLMAEGKTVKIICVGKKGNDILRRQFRDQIIESPSGSASRTASRRRTHRCRSA
jgi:F-type H+-transporting ATPase subunit gamma